MGDAAGIGPEVILKSISDRTLKDICEPVIIGDLAFLRKTAKELGLDIPLTEASAETNTGVKVYDLSNLAQQIVLGEESAVAGKASGEYIEKAVELCQKGEIDAIATAPISKKSLSLGGYDFPGHTEFLAHLTDTKEFAMSFFGGELRVVLLSIHTALRNAITLVKKERIVELIRFTDAEMSRLLKKPVKLAMAGLNPHASEGGMFGTEEQDEIIPAVSECREQYGIDVSGPFSPDTIFMRAWRGEFDVVVSCYHDQATIAVKCLAFGESVNVTLGLPIIRTSVDHGTAFDIAGKNIADESSMKAAIRLAAKLSL